MTLVWIRLALIAAVLASAAGAGWHFRGVEAQAAQAAAMQAALRQQAAQQAATEQVAQQTAAEQARIRTVVKTIVRRIPVYVTKQDDAGCHIPAGFVRVLDAAASLSPVSGAPGRPDAAGAVAEPPAAHP